jgi:membrane-bound lytic murein transglycosylase A
MMVKTTALLLLGLGLNFSTPALLFAQESPLHPIELDASKSLGRDEQLWGSPDKSGDRPMLLRAIDRSLRYLNTQRAAQSYRNYLVPGITRDRVRRSLLRFRQLLVNSTTAKALQAAVEREFVFYQSVGQDNQGTVLFTGYFEPIFVASRRPTSEYRYPLYRKPTNFDRWSQPHPTRLELEGKDGLLGKKSPLSGYELVWLRDRLEAFLVQVQGSAKLRLTDGSTMMVGHAGNTNYPYTSIGRELVNEGVFSLEELTLPKVIRYFQTHPQQIDQYLPRNNRFIFFQQTRGTSPTGSLGLPVTADRTIATDKSMMPPGALALIHTTIPYPNRQDRLENELVSRYVLDQDTGSAIKGAGRVDIFMGSGKVAGERAGLMNGTGELYYLLLKQ